MTTHTYSPGFTDRIEPVVIVGHPISEGAPIEVIKQDVDPARRFVHVRDNTGNVQSVNRASLKVLT